MASRPHLQSLSRATLREGGDRIRGSANEPLHHTPPPPVEQQPTATCDVDGEGDDASSVDSELDAYYRACAPRDDRRGGRPSTGRGKGKGREAEYSSASEGSGGGGHYTYMYSSFSDESSSGGDDERGLSGGQRVGGRSAAASHHRRVGAKQHRTAAATGRGYGDDNRSSRNTDDTFSNSGSGDDEGSEGAFDSYAARHMAGQGVSPMRGKPSLSLTTPHRTAARNRPLHRSGTASATNPFANTVGGSKAANRSVSGGHQQPSSSSSAAAAVNALRQRHQHSLAIAMPSAFRNPQAQAHIERMQRGLLEYNGEHMKGGPPAAPLTRRRGCTCSNNKGDRHRSAPCLVCGSAFVAAEIIDHVAHQEPSRLFAVTGVMPHHSSPAEKGLRGMGVAGACRWEPTAEALRLSQSLGYGDGASAAVGAALAAASAARLLEAYATALVAECDATIRAPPFPSSSAARTGPAPHAGRGDRRLHRDPSSSAAASGPLAADPVEVLAALVLRRFADMCGTIAVELCRPPQRPRETLADDEAFAGIHFSSAPPLPPHLRRRASSNNSGPPMPPAADGETFARPVDLLAWAQSATATAQRLTALFDACLLLPRAVTSSAATTNGRDHSSDPSAVTASSAALMAGIGGGTAKRSSSVGRGGGAVFNVTPPRTGRSGSTAPSSAANPTQVIAFAPRAAVLLERLLSAIDEAQRTCRHDAHRLFAELYIYAAWPLFELLGQGVTGTGDDPMASVSLSGGYVCYGNSSINNSNSRHSVDFPSRRPFADIFGDDGHSARFEALMRSALGLGGGGAAGLLLSPPTGGGGSGTSRFPSAAVGGGGMFGAAVASAEELAQLVAAAKEVRAKGVLGGRERRRRDHYYQRGLSALAYGKGSAEAAEFAAAAAGGGAEEPHHHSGAPHASSSRLVPSFFDEEGSNWGSNPASARTSGVVAGAPPTLVNASSAAGSSSVVLVGGGGASDAVTVIGQAPDYGDGQQQQQQRSGGFSSLGGRPHGRAVPTFSAQHEQLLSTYAGNSYTRAVLTALREGGTDGLTAVTQFRANGDGNNNRKASRYGVVESGAEDDGSDGSDFDVADYVREAGDAEGGGNCAYGADGLFADAACADLLGILGACEEEDAHSRAASAAFGRERRPRVGFGISHVRPPSSQQQCYLRVVDAPFPDIFVDTARTLDSELALLGAGGDLFSRQRRRRAAGDPRLPSRVCIDFGATACAWLRAVFVAPLTRIVAHQQLLVVRSLLAPPSSSITLSTSSAGGSGAGPIGLLGLIRLFRDVCFFAHPAMSEVFLQQLLDAAEAYAAAAQQIAQAQPPPHHTGSTSAHQQHQQQHAAHYRAQLRRQPPWFHRLAVDEIKSARTVSSSQRIAAAYAEAALRIPNGHCAAMVVMPRVGAPLGEGGANSASASTTPPPPFPDYFSGGGAQRHILDTIEAIRFHFYAPPTLHFACPSLSATLRAAAAGGVGSAGEMTSSSATAEGSAPTNIAVWLALDSADVYSRVFARIAALRYAKGRLLARMKEMYGDAKRQHSAAAVAAAAAKKMGPTFAYTTNQQQQLGGGASVRRNYILRVVLDAFIEYVLTSVEEAARRYEAACNPRQHHQNNQNQRGGANGGATMSGGGGGGVATLAELKAAHEAFVQRLRVALFLPPPTQPTASVLATQLAAMREALRGLLLLALGEVEAEGGLLGGGGVGGAGNPTAHIDTTVAKFVSAAEKLPGVNVLSAAAAAYYFGVGDPPQASAASPVGGSSSSGSGYGAAAVDYYLAVKPLVHKLTFNDYFTSTVSAE